MNAKSVILKSENQTQVSVTRSIEGICIQKIVMPISPLSFINLMHHADSKVNPRKAKINPIVKAIEETLQFSPELYFFSSKGILLSSIYVDLLDRNRVRLSFSEEEMEGIMDGGHNAFALCRFIANVINDDNLITWDDCIRYYRNEDTFASLKVGYESHIGQLKFSIPIEVIAPVDKDEASIEYFSNHILEICSARNANVSLNEATKSNKEGLYEDLKRCLKGSYRENIAWRSGESGTIKCDDIVALACLPLIKLHECGYFDGNPNIGILNRIAIYSQKSLCVKYYRNLMKDKSVSEQQLGKYDLTDNAIRSGFELVDDIVRFFDKIYYHFPMVYNRNSGSFGRITGVVQKENETGGYISKFTGPFNTYPKRSIYNYAYGFFYPIICALTSLMEFENGKLKWRINPLTINFEDEKVINNFAFYIDMVKQVQYDPQKVGKSSLSYKVADIVLQNIMNEMLA